MTKPIKISMEDAQLQFIDNVYPHSGDSVYADFPDNLWDELDDYMLDMGYFWHESEDEYVLGVENDENPDLAAAFKRAKLKALGIGALVGMVAFVAIWGMLALIVLALESVGVV